MADPALYIVIDVGNSGAKLGAVRGEDVTLPRRLPAVDGRSVRTLAEPLLAPGESVRFVVYGSDPGKAKDLAWEIERLRLGPATVLGADSKGVPPPLVDHPERAGMDRRIQALGAAALAGGPSAVVSCGTALTVDVASAEGALAGGAILPGLTLGMRALAAATARLPVVDLTGEICFPARNTETAIRTGVVLGAARAVEGLLDELAEAPSAIWLTGQDAPLLAPHLLRPVREHPGLGLFGAAEAARRG
jgi:pantothenate kinase type III